MKYVRLAVVALSVAFAVAATWLAWLGRDVPTPAGQSLGLKFLRSKYDAEQTIDAFAARLREQVDVGALEGELLAVDETLQPARASVWLRGNTER